MLLTLLIVWRESFEAALVVGILLTFVARSDRPSAVRYVWAASLAGIPVALPCAAGLDRLLDRLGPDTQALTQSELQFMAAAILFSTVLWMQDWARLMRRGLSAESPLATRLILTTAFAAVFWETVETMLFLRGTGGDAGSPTVPLVAAGIAGCGLAVASVWLFFRGFAFVRIEQYLRVASVLLVVVAGGLLAAAVDKVGELGYLPVPLEQFPRIGGTGSIAAALRIVAGYNPQAPVLEVLATLAYVPAMLWALRLRSQARAGLGLDAQGRAPAIVLRWRRRGR